MGMITSATSVRDLAGCVAAHGDAMDERKVSAALVKLVKQREFSSASGEVQAPAAQLMQTLLQMVVEAPGTHGQLSRIDAMASRQLCNSLWAVVKGGCEAHPAFQGMLARLCADGHAALATCVAQELSNLAWAVAKAVERSPGVAMGLGQVSSLFEAIAKAWVGGAGSDCKPQEVANLLWAFAKVGCLGPAVAQSLWKPVACMDLATFTPQALSNLLWALATGGAWDPAIAQPLLARVGRMDLAAFRPQELSNLLWALAAGRSWDPVFAQLLCDQILRRGLAAFEPQHMSNILWALATGGHADWPLPEAVCVEAVRRRVSGWKAQELANTVWALSTLAEGRMLPRRQVALQGRLLDVVAEAVVHGGMVTASPQEWSNLLWGFATLRHSAPALFAAAVDLMQPHLTHFTAQGLSNVLLAYGAAAPPDSLSALVDRWQGQLGLQLSASNDQDLSNAAWALAVAGGVGSGASGRGRLARALLAEAGRRDVRRFKSVDLTQLHQLSEEVACGGARARSLMSVTLREAACRARTAGALLSKASTVSRDICRVLQGMGVDAQLERPSPCGFSTVDIEVTSRSSDTDSPSSSAAGRVVAVEVDGPFHFMTNDATLPDGATRLRDRQLSRSYGRPVVAINVMTEWASKRSVEREQMLHQRLGLHTPLGRVPVKVADDGVLQVGAGQRRRRQQQRLPGAAGGGRHDGDC